jgi:hypothetical protein
MPERNRPLLLQMAYRIAILANGVALGELKASARSAARFAQRQTNGVTWLLVRTEKNKQKRTSVWPFWWGAFRKHLETFTYLCAPLDIGSFSKYLHAIDFKEVSILAWSGR